MRVGYFEARLTPLSVIAQDIEFASLESEYGQKPKEPENNGPIRK